MELGTRKKISTDTRKGCYSAKGNWQNGTCRCYGKAEGDEEQYVNIVNPQIDFAQYQKIIRVSRLIQRLGLPQIEKSFECVNMKRI